jgi:anthranilate phosphoribosyltransferase
LERCIEDHHFGYIEALDTRYKHIHHQTHDVARLPHMNDIIGPITSPINPHLMTRRVVGLNQLVPPRIVAEAYRIMNQRRVTDLHRGFFVRGFADKFRTRGIDEVSICPGGTQVAELCDGEIREFTITASDFGLPPVPPDSISPPKGMSKGEFSLRILNGEISGPPLQMVLANASLLFVLAGRAPNFRHGYEMAEEVFASGIVPAKVEKVKLALA